MKNTNKSQSLKILNHMMKRPITPLEALNKFGCFRLAARIHELKNMGWTIRSSKVTRNNKTIAQYSLN
jgi:hypothetical protein